MAVPWLPSAGSLPSPLPSWCAGICLLFRGSLSCEPLVTGSVTACVLRCCLPAGPRRCWPPHPWVWSLAVVACCLLHSWNQVLLCCCPIHHQRPSYRTDPSLLQGPVGCRGLPAACPPAFFRELLLSRGLEGGACALTLRLLFSPQPEPHWKSSSLTSLNRPPRRSPKIVRSWR